MSKLSVDLTTVVKRLNDNDNILILCHRRPDGDTVGSAFGIYLALKQKGKNVRIDCADPFSKKLEYFYKNYSEEFFELEYVIAVDTASAPLLGSFEQDYGDKVDLVIDHHISNTFFGKETYLDSKAAATTEICYTIVKALGVNVTPEIADALYTGLVTDTGCFRFSNVTPNTHRTAAFLIEDGANYTEINRIHFESASKERLNVEAMARNAMEYYEQDKIALLYLPATIYKDYNVEEEDIEGITSLPRMITGVNIGLTIKENNDDSYRISVRSFAPYDSSAICDKFGGGGHKAAAGCAITGKLEDVKKQLLTATIEELNKY